LDALGDGLKISSGLDRFNENVQQNQGYKYIYVKSFKTGNGINGVTYDFIFNNGQETKLKVTVQGAFTFLNNIFVDNFNKYKSEAIQELGDKAAQIENLLGQYLALQRIVESSKEVYNSGVKRIEILNGLIKKNSGELNTASSSLESKQALSTSLSEKLASIRVENESSKKEHSDCKTEGKSIQKVIDTYQAYDDEFDDDYQQRHFNTEQTNFCLFNQVAEDLALILPSTRDLLFPLRKRLADQDNSSIDEVRELFKSNKFFLLSEQ